MTNSNKVVINEEEEENLMDDPLKKLADDLKTSWTYTLLAGLLFHDF